jgi:hypothetical protein
MAACAKFPLSPLEYEFVANVMNFDSATSGGGGKRRKSKCRSRMSGGAPLSKETKAKIMTIASAVVLGTLTIQAAYAAYDKLGFNETLADANEGLTAMLKMCATPGGVARVQTASKYIETPTCSQSMRALENAISLANANLRTVGLAAYSSVSMLTVTTAKTVYNKYLEFFATDSPSCPTEAPPAYDPYNPIVIDVLPPYDTEKSSVGGRKRKTAHKKSRKPKRKSRKL